MKSSGQKRLFIVALAATLLVVGLYSVFRHGYDAMLLLADLAHIDLPLPDTRATFERREITYRRDQRRQAADLYLPSGLVGAGIVLVPGAAEGGRRDPRLVEFAQVLARSAFVVLVPDIVSLRELRPSPDSARDIIAAITYLRSAEPLAPSARLGVGAFSIAAGPAVLAALDPVAGEQINFLFLVGGYHDLKRTLSYLTTGYFQDGSQPVYREPNIYGKWVYALSNAARLQDEADREALSAIARRKLDDSDAVVEPLLAQLGAEGQAVYDFIVNTDPTNVAGLMQKLPASVRADIDALNLAAYDLSSVQAHFILLHGFDDDIIPYTESVSLAAALPPGKAQLFLLDGLHHVDQDFHGLDTWRSWRAMQALLNQQD